MLRCFFTAWLVIVSFAALAQSPVTVKQEANQFKKNLLEHHVNPRPIDDSFSKDVFDLFLKILDPNRQFFSQQDIAQISVYRTMIDDELNGSSWQLLPDVTQRLAKNLQKAQKTIEQHTVKPFDFTKDGVYKANSDWPADEKEMDSRWIQHLKLETLNELIRLKKSSTINEKDFLKSKESEARNNVRKSAMRTVQRVIEHPMGYDDYVSSSYVRAIGLAFDPHSVHLSFAEMNDYITSLGTEGYYFGITISENDRGEIIIDELTPGGAAWRSGMVHSGDVIEKVRWGANEWIVVSDMSRAGLNDLLMESNHVVMEFALIEGSGLRKNVLLKKEKMESEDNIVKSLILTGNKKIGYISLPGFYSAWGGSESSRCANDVAKEILKLKKENIEGLILDVRYNGGGSLYEAVAMAGIFIDAGPMGLIKDKTGDVISIKDMNRGTVYDGPLVLMVNGLSASASEFLAAALQDYNRAVIVGSNTYGKATGQRIFPMQPGKLEIDHTLDINSGWGFSTITCMKIYRVTGKTAQKYGVTPDIILPDLYDLAGLGESYATGALPSDSVIKKTYYTPLTPLPVKELKSNSIDRIKASEAFQLTRECSEQLAVSMDNVDTVSLTWAGFAQVAEKEAKIFLELQEACSQPSKSFKIKTHAFNLQRLQMDDYARQQNESWIEKLSRDISLEEAYFIICDYIAVGSAN
jgi:carboxyl-terminal processing protease